MTSPALTSIPRRQPAYHSELLDDELLLYNPAGDQILQLNASAGLVWQLCDGANSTQAIIALLVEAYPEAAAEIRVDVPEILAQCVEAGCLTLD